MASSGNGMRMAVDCSVLICTWNNSRRLAQTLHTITRCAVPRGMRWELVLINNQCADDTDQVARAFERQLPLVLLHEPVLGVSRARNTGLAAVNGQLVIFTDDDVTPDPRWLSAYWHAYQARPTGYFFGGPIESEFEGPSLDSYLRRFAPYSVKGLDYGAVERPLRPRHPLIAPNWACPVAMLRQVGGFDIRKGLNAVPGQVRVGSETHVMRQLRKQGWRAWYVPDARVRHFVPSNKTMVQHIAVRLEASAFDQASTLLWGDHPWLVWGLCMAARLWAAAWRTIWWCCRNRFNEVWAYLKWREAIGWLKGLSDAQREITRNHSRTEPRQT